MATAHAAVDEAVAILRDGRSKPHKRIDKAAKDFVTEVDLASESATALARGIHAGYRRQRST